MLKTERLKSKKNIIRTAENGLAKTFFSFFYPFMFLNSIIFCTFAQTL
jgi:hypothetical protein